MKAFDGFSGFGGAHIALKRAGFEVIGVELDDAIAQVARDNGHDIVTTNLLDTDPYRYAGCDLMHFSPPCPSFSLANSNAGETENDLALARKIAQFVRASRPRFFTLENVWLYRRSNSWKYIIKPALEEAGYTSDFWLLNAADYGVPQTRKRMIVAARLDGGAVIKPFQSHSKTGDLFTSPWVGWYEAIEDLIPGLPESEFAPWQKRAMPAKLKYLLELVECGGYVAAESFLVDGQNAGPKTVNAKSWNEPTMTITDGNKGVPRAFVIGGQQPTPTTVQHRNGNKPLWTVTTKDNARVKAFIFGDQYRQIAPPTRPMFTVMTRQSGGAPPRAFVEPRVVSMTPEALARFQDFPHDYKLPGHNGLACRGIGNALPPAVMAAVVEMLLSDELVKVETNRERRSNDGQG